MFLSRGTILQYKLTWALYVSNDVTYIGQCAMEYEDWYQQNTQEAIAQKLVEVTKAIQSNEKAMVEARKLQDAPQMGCLVLECKRLCAEQGKLERLVKRKQQKDKMEHAWNQPNFPDWLFDFILFAYIEPYGWLLFFITLIVALCVYFPMALPIIICSVAWKRHWWEALFAFCMYVWVTQSWQE